jgi:excisionase family DNA binding protein
MSTEERLKRLFDASPEQLAVVDKILEGKFQTTTVEAVGPLLMGMKAAAKFLGVSRTTLWRMVIDGRLKRVEVLPGSFRLRRADLEAIANNN